LKFGITSKIIIVTAIAVTISLVLTGLFEYFYFLDILISNSIDDEKINLKQTEQQFSFIQDDVKTYSQDIIVDSVVREILYSNNKEYDIFEEYDIFNHFVNLTALRDYVHSIILLTANNYMFGSIERINNNYLMGFWPQTLEISGHMIILLIIFSKLIQLFLL
jgi:hypothetical protein